MEAYGYILRAGIELFGHEVQREKIIEECLELALALNQLKCPTKEVPVMLERVYEEIADVHIMMAQARILFDSKRIDQIIKQKIERFERLYLQQEKESQND